jgi:hypothetical protein
MKKTLRGVHGFLCKTEVTMRFGMAANTTSAMGSSSFRTATEKPLGWDGIPNFETTPCVFLELM